MAKQTVCLAYCGNSVDGGTEDAASQIFESERMCIVSVSSVNFEKDLKWRFSTDTIKFSARILDEDFLSKVEKGEIAFSKGVSLKITLKEVQTLDKTGTTKTEYEVLRVHEIITRPEQLSLPLA